MSLPSQAEVDDVRPCGFKRFPSLVRQSTMCRAPHFSVMPNFGQWVHKLGLRLIKDEEFVARVHFPRGILTRNLPDSSKFLYSVVFWCQKLAHQVPWQEMVTALNSPESSKIIQKYAGNFRGFGKVRVEWDYKHFFSAYK